MPSSVESALSKIFPEEAPKSLTTFTRYWLTLRRGRLMPERRDIDPIEIPWALGLIYILKRQPDGRFAYHLVGEEMASMLGGRMKGKAADQVFEPVYARFVEARWQKIAREQLICFNGSYYLTVGNVPRLARRIVLPLSSDDRTVDELIGLVHYERKGAMAGERELDPNYRFVHWTPVAEIRE